MATVTDPSLATLFHPFETGTLVWPQGRVLFLYAAAHPSLGAAGAVDCWQPFYPDAAGLPSVVQDPAPPYDAVWLRVPKDRREAQYALAKALTYTRTGGRIVAAAANDANGNRLEHWFRDMGLEPSSLSKNKARAVWAVRSDAARAPDEWIAAGGPRRIELGGQTYWTQAGLFGADKIDAGSALLVRHLPSVLSGHGADFGCGYGYLSRHILDRAPPDSLTAIDADRRAVACCMKNCAGVTGLWADLTRPHRGGPYDWIVMNPPFHAGKKTDSDIGVAFIETAAGALKKGGRLYMVANRQLPYEGPLARHFDDLSSPAAENGFKLLFARRK